MRMILSALLFIFWATSSVALVNYDSDTRTLILSGSSDDRMMFQSSLIFNSEDVDVVVLSGPGGFMDVGIRIGRLIRQSGAVVVINPETECVSACAFSALGGVSIENNGTLLFHRPFLTQVPAFVTVDEIGGHIGGLYMELAEYIIEMGYDFSIAREIIDNTNRCTYLAAISHIDFVSMIVEDRCN